ncbi:MAG: ABC transporter permease [Actinobacteria bacterium]|nr:ABC transporter permease [Actinomycetota bacterium]
MSVEAVEIEVPVRQPWWKRLARNKLSLVTVVLIVALGLVALLAGVIAPFSATQPAGLPIEKPSWDHLLGTDEIGRDIFSRLLFGSRISLYVGFGASAIAMVLGVPLGVASGYFGRFVDSVIMRVVDGMLAFPPIILAMATVAVLGPNLRNTILAIGIVQIPRFARQSRAMASSLREREFVQASRALGGSHVHVMLRTLLPNMVPIILVQMTLTFATAVLTEAALSFLGLGTQPPSPSWGAMLSSGKTLLSLNPWIAVGAGTSIFVTVLLFTLLGDALTDLLNPYRIER